MFQINFKGQCGFLSREDVTIKIPEISTLLLILMFTGCELSQVNTGQPAPSVEKVDARREISGSVAEPDAPVISQNAYLEAVNSLLASAQSQFASTNYTAAAASIERALRINPRSTQAYHRLAEVRLQQGRFGEAEQLAKKALYYVNFGDRDKDNEYKAQLWRVIADARFRNGDNVGAERALVKAKDFH